MPPSPGQPESSYAGGVNSATPPGQVNAAGKTALIERVLDEYSARRARGEDVDPETLAAHYPGIADELLEYLRGADLLDRLFPGDATSSAAAASASQAAVELPVRIDEYEIIKEIGRGGMGVVYLARQDPTQRVVALKVMLSGPFASARSRARFQREMRLAARLDHPNIASVLAGGTYAGRCYYVMECVRGCTVDHYVRAHRDQVAKLLSLFARICDAVHFAHQRGVIHRDLKPANILVNEDGEPHILDFGLAKSLEPELGADAIQTGSIPGHIVGTLPYIAPELAAGSVSDVDVRSDVYALGVMLFEGLTGHAPYSTDGSTLEALRTIIGVAPPPPSRMRPGLTDEIDAIVLRALEKSKERRYQSAEALGDDLRRCLAGDPVEAKRHSRSYVLRKTLRRYRSQVVGGLVAVLCLAAFAVSSTLLWVGAERQRLTAENLSGRLAGTADQLRRELHAGNLQRGLAMLRSGDWYKAEGVLWSEFFRCPDPAAYWAMWTYYLENPVQLVGSSVGWARACTYLPLSKAVVFANREGDLTLFPELHPPDNRAFSGYEGAITFVGAVDHGRRFVTAGDDGTVRLWTPAKDHPIQTRTVADGPIIAAAMPANGTWLATCIEGGSIAVWDLAALMEQPQKHDHNPAQHARLCELPAPGSVDALAASPDGKHLAVAGLGESVLVWPIPPDGPPTALRVGPKGAISVAFSPSGERLACGLFGRVALFDVQDQRELWSMPAHSRWVLALTFSSEGRILATGGWDGLVHLLDARRGKVIRTLRGFGTAVYTLEFSQDERNLFIGSIGQLRSVQPLRPEALTLRRDLPVAESRAVALDDLRGTLAYAATEGGIIETASLVDGRVTQLVTGHQARVDCLAYSPTGTHLLSGDIAGLLEIRSCEEPARVRAIDAAQGRLRCVAFSPDGNTVATGGDDGDVVLRDSSTLAEQRRLTGHSGAVRCLAFAPDGTRLASGGADFNLIVHDLQTGAILFEAPAREWINTVLFSRDGRQVISTGADLYLRVYDQTGLEVQRRPRPHEHWVNCMALMSSDSVLVTGGHDRTVKLWALPDLEPLTSIQSLHGSVYSLAVSGDRRHLAVGAEKGVTVYDCQAPDRLMQRHLDRWPTSHTRPGDDQAGDSSGDAASEAQRRVQALAELSVLAPDLAAALGQPPAEAR